MSKKYQTIKQDLSSISAHYAYEANMNYTLDQMVDAFRKNINKRKDLSRHFKSFLLSQSIAKNYEIVYYPVYFYKTESELSWNTTSKRSSDVYANHSKVGTVTTKTTTSHSKGGIMGISTYGEVKKQHLELAVDDINKKELTTINNFRTLSLPVYEDGLFFTRDENGENAITAGSIASKQKGNQNIYVEWEAKVVFVPIARCVFNYNGKEYFFEMNLHNGKFVTKYKQKAFNATMRCFTWSLFMLMHAIIFLLPAIITTIGIMALGFNDPGGQFLTIVLFFGSMLGMLGLQFFNIIVYKFWGRPKPRHFAFEKATSNYNPFKYIAFFRYLGFYSFFVIALTLTFGYFLFI